MPTLSFKVSPEEALFIRRKAREHKSTVSEYLRKSALEQKPTRKHKPRIEKHPVSGLPYDAGSIDEPKVTRDQIVAALGDFP